MGKREYKSPQDADWEFYMSQLENIGKQLDEVVKAEVLGAIKRYPKPFKDKELEGRRRAVMDKWDVVLKKAKQTFEI